MQVRFLTDVEIEVFESDEDDFEASDTETYKAGDIEEFDVFGHPHRMVDGELVEDPNLVNVQFGDGSVAFGLSTEWYEVLEGR